MYVCIKSTGMYLVNDTITALEYYRLSEERKKCFRIKEAKSHSGSGRWEDSQPLGMGYSNPGFIENDIRSAATESNDDDRFGGFGGGSFGGGGGGSDWGSDSDSSSSDSSSSDD